MDKEIQSIARNFRNVLEGQPWYGRAVYEILNETETSDVYKKPNGNGHSAIELLYHMITWAEFTLTRLNNDSKKDMAYFEKIDWRQIDPSEHTWKAGMKQLKDIHQEIIGLLETKDDSLQFPVSSKWPYPS
jgi:hypothetical protein